MPYLPAVIVLMLLYMTSLVGVTSANQQAWYLSYVPFFLYLNAFFLFLYHQNWNKKALIFCSTIIFLGLVLEVLAVQTQAIFGAYYFGNTLGSKVLETPIVMGFYWFILTYSSGCLAAKLPLSNKLATVGVATLLMLSLTGLIQQVAAPLGFWEVGANAVLPYYLVWGIVGFGLQYLFAHLKVDTKNKMAVYVYGGLAIFFVGLVMFLPR